MKISESSELRSDAKKKTYNACKSARGEPRQ